MTTTTGIRPRGPCNWLGRCTGPMPPFEAITMPVSLAWKNRVALLRLARGKSPPSNESILNQAIPMTIPDTRTPDHCAHQGNRACDERHERLHQDDDQRASQRE